MNGFDQARPAEARVRDLIIAGKTSPRIAEEVGRSLSTIKNQTVRIFRAYGVSNRIELAAAVKGGGTASRLRPKSDPQRATAPEPTRLGVRAKLVSTTLAVDSEFVLNRFVAVDDAHIAPFEIATAPGVFCAGLTYSIEITVREEPKR